MLRLAALLSLLAAPVAAQDLFQGEAADPIMSAAIGTCLKKASPEAVEQCRFHVSDDCDMADDTSPDTCFLREAASWDRAMRRAFPGALGRAQEADAFERGQGREGQSERLLLDTQRLFEIYRAQTCDAEAAPYGSYGEGLRTYVNCLIRMTSDQALRLVLWGEI